MLLNLFFEIIQSFLLETKTFSSIRDDFLIINVFQKKTTPESFTIAAKIIQNYQSPIFELYIRNYPGFTTMEWRYTTDSSDSRPCRVFLHICVTLLPTPKKKIYVGTERSPHQPNDNNITQNKGSNFIHHSIIYCEERDKIQKNASSTSDDLSETIATELFINKSHVILHALQKLQYIYKFQWDFPLSLLLSLSTILIIIHYSLLHWCNAMGKQGPKSWLLDKNISG